MIAQVIVDVAAKQTDRVFEYHIPQELTDVAVGSRVVVPFGRRKVQGFVVGISKTTSYTGKLKDLLVVVDELPPLTPELITLSKTLADKIFCVPNYNPAIDAAKGNEGKLSKNFSSNY